MKTIQKFVNKYIFILAITLVFSTFSIAQESNALISNLYKAHKKKSVLSWNKPALKNYFSDNLANLIYKSQQKNDEGIGFDILFDTQDDSDIKTYKVVTESAGTKQGISKVSVSFKNFGESKKLIFTVDNKTNKIKDIQYLSHNSSLVKLLSN